MVDSALAKAKIKEATEAVDDLSEENDKVRRGLIHALCRKCR